MIHDGAVNSNIIQFWELAFEEKSLSWEYLGLTGSVHKHDKEACLLPLQTKTVLTSLLVPNLKGQHRLVNKQCHGHSRSLFISKPMASLLPRPVDVLCFEQSLEESDWDLDQPACVSWTGQPSWFWNNCETILPVGNTCTKELRAFSAFLCYEDGLCPFQLKRPAYRSMMFDCLFIKSATLFINHWTGNEPTQLHRLHPGLPKTGRGWSPRV